MAEPYTYNPDVRPILDGWLNAEPGDEQGALKHQARLLIERLESRRLMAFCIWCGKVFAGDPQKKEDVAQIRREMQDHDHSCEKNPLAEEVKRLRGAIREALRHDLAPGGWGGPAAENILIKALAAKPQAPSAAEGESEISVRPDPDVPGYAEMWVNGYCVIDQMIWAEAEALAERLRKALAAKDPPLPEAMAGKGGEG